MEPVDVELQHVSKGHENFLKDFIKTYRENEVLWDKKQPQYKNRDARERAFEPLLDVCLEYYPDANLDFVRMKIDSIRGAFRREYNKVQVSKKKAKSEADIYVPALWYYNLLLFIVGEEINEELEKSKDYSKLIYLWSKDYTVTLIELLKTYPILYTDEGSGKGTKSKRIKAYLDLTNKLNMELGRQFEVSEVKYKIRALKSQFRKEYRERGKSMKKSSTLWCYDLLTFLKDPLPLKKHEVQSEVDPDISDENTENLWINYEADSDTDRKDEQTYEEKDQDDIYDTIGKNLAIKLRDMSDDQRVYAENLINEIMYNGLMENLNANCRIIFTGD